MIKSNPELNMRIATEVFGYKVTKQRGVLIESRPAGDRPLKNYCQEIESALEVAHLLKITLIPGMDHQWFAFIGAFNLDGWESPNALLKFLDAGEFTSSGAAADPNAATAICKAAINYLEYRRKKELKKSEAVLTEIAPDETSSIH